MGKLRLKETDIERSQREREEDRRSSKKRRKKHAKDGSSSSRYYDNDGLLDESRHVPKPSRNSDEDDSDAWVPPRPSKDRPYVPYSFDDDTEESRLPPSGAHKNDRMHEQEDFNQKLFEAMAEDEGFDPYSNHAHNSGISFDYREDLMDRRSGYGASGVATDRFVDPSTGAILNRVVFKDAMTEDEYAEHIRQGMFRRTRKEELARQEELAKLKAAKERKKAEDLARMRAVEAERERKLEERARKKAQAGTIKSREAYQAAWARLVDPKTQNEDLRSDEFPWPIPPGGGGEIDKKAVKDFLTAHLEEEDSKKVKQAIRTAVLAYHPDRFDRYVARVKNEKERDSVRAMGLRISQILNELLQDL